MTDEKGTTMQITDEMCRRALEEWGGDRIQGFSTNLDTTRGKWGAPHYIRDMTLPAGKQEIWRGNNQDEMLNRCEIERMRLALSAALSAIPQAA